MSKITYEVVEHGGGRYLPGPSDTPFAYKKRTQPKQAELARKYDNHIPEIPTSRLATKSASGSAQRLAIA